MHGNIKTIDDLNRFYRAYSDAQSREFAAHIANPTIAKLAYERVLRTNALSSAARNDQERFILFRYQPTIEADVEEIVRERAAFRAELGLGSDEVAAAPSQHIDEMRPTDVVDGATIGKGIRSKNHEELGIRFSLAQSDRARKPRGRFDDDRTKQEVVSSLALSPEYIGSQTKELWCHFYYALRDIGVEPKKEPPKPNQMFVNYSYMLRDVRRTIGYKHFANMVSIARRKKSH